jgi:hypothetical protein
VQEFRFVADPATKAPADLAPWLLATSPAMGEVGSLCKEPVRIALATQKVAALFDAYGEELRVVWELEPGTRVLERAALPQPTGFDEPRRLDAFLDAVRWGAISSANVRALHLPFRSGINFEDYQLDIGRALVR